MSDEHDGVKNDIPVALDSTYSTAHFSDNSDPNIMVNNDDALAEDLAKLINSSEYDKAADTFSTTSPAYPICNTDQPNMHYKQMINNPIKQEGDDQLKNVISGIANTFMLAAGLPTGYRLRYVVSRLVKSAEQLLGNCSATFGDIWEQHLQHS